MEKQLNNLSVEQINYLRIVTRVFRHEYKKENYEQFARAEGKILGFCECLAQLGLITDREGFAYWILFHWNME